MAFLRSEARAPLVVGALAVALLVAGCGEKRGESGTGTGTEATATTESKPSQATGPVQASVQVSETEYRLDPSDPEVTKAGVVEFTATSDGKTAHALEIETPGGELKTDSIEPGKSAKLKADLKPGRYEWYCPIDDHKGRGMKGEITVGRGGSSAKGSGAGKGKEADGY